MFDFTPERKSRTILVAHGPREFSRARRDRGPWRGHLDEEGKFPRRRSATRPLGLGLMNLEVAGGLRRALGLSSA